MEPLTADEIDWAGRATLAENLNVATVSEILMRLGSASASPNPANFRTHSSCPSRLGQICRFGLCAVLLGLLWATRTVAQNQEWLAKIGSSLTFHASFDQGPNADLAFGDGTLQHAPSLSKQAEAKPGLPETGEVQLTRGAGRFGDALRFTRKQSPMIFFRAARNVSYQRTNWSGTVSFWLSVDPAAELENGFCDPIQITPRAWNDAAFFVEFEKRAEGIPFRLGVYPDFKIWNPTNRKWEEIPMTEKPLATVPKPPFSRGKWTHVVFTFENFNTGRDDGSAQLYLDGALAAPLAPRRQTFTWDEEKSLIMLGLGYIGLWDELAIFDRALNPEEVAQLHHLKNGARDLRTTRLRAR
jgi:hypothetical protein